MAHHRQVYTQPQLESYFNRISLPISSRHFSANSLSSTNAQLEFLAALQKHQLMQVPFENLTLHYSWHRVIHLDPDHLFDKIVNHERGGYCMENNSFFHTILLSLGFDAYMVGARPYDIASSRYGGFTHCLNIVTLGNVRYAIDVCFGSRVPLLPLKLQPGEVQPHSGLGQMRVRHGAIPQALCSHGLWIYEYRSNNKAGFVPQYCFVDYEFLPDDIDAINWAPAKSPSSFFTQKVVCVKFTAEREHYSSEYPDEGEQHKLDRQGDAGDVGAIDGALIVDGDVLSWKKNGAVRWERKFKTEAERICAINRYFNIALTQTHELAIRGTVGEVKNKSGSLGGERRKSG